MRISVDYRAPYDITFRGHPYVGLYGGRAGGKSHFFAEYLILRALRAKERIFCTREIQNTIKESVKFLLEKKIAKFVVGDFFECTKEEIRCVSTGSQFIFRGLRDFNSQSIKSLEDITICWVEEAHTITEHSLELLLPTIRGDGAQILFSWNPEQIERPDGLPGDPVARLFLGDPPLPGSVARQVNWSDNPHFPEHLDTLRRWQQSRDPVRYAHIWEGQPNVQSELLVFRNWKVDRFEAPLRTNFLFGADWGFSSSPTVLVRFWVDMPRRRLFVDHEAYRTHVLVQHTPDLFLQVPGSEDWRIIADSEDPQIIAAMKKYGFRIVGAKKGKDSKRSGLKWLQDFDIVIHERCVNTIREFGTYKYKIDRATGQPTPIPEDTNDHAIDAIRYGAEDLIRKGDVLSRRISIVA